jgi:hypothetical protein
MRVGRVVVGVVVVLAAVAAAFFVHTSRADDPNDSTGSPPDRLCASAAPAESSTAWGIEVDKNQHTDSNAGNWPRLAAREHPPSFAYLKVSQGQSDPVQVNHFAQRDTEAARAVGIVVGFVHWAEPGQPKRRSIEQDAVAEARHAVRSMGGSLRGTLPPALALGLNRRNLPPDDIATWTLTWLAEVERLVERPPVVVASTRFLTKSIDPVPELARYPLWLVGEGCLPEPWSDWTFRDAGRSGLGLAYFVSEPGAVDYAGSRKQLTDVASTGTGIGPGPAPAHAHRFD